MPNNLILIRHGESEGSIAANQSKNGDHSAYESDFKNRHSSFWRLTDKGREQAVATGHWIKKNLGITFDKFYTSEYLRAMETAGLMKLKDASWFPDFYLRERSWGALDRLSIKDRHAKFQESMRDREIETFYWRPPGGESLAEICLRIDRFINTLHRECDGKNVVVVCHGEVMWAFRVRLERMSQDDFHALEVSKDAEDRIRNCQILHYTRSNPHEKNTSPEIYLKWMKSVCPWDEKKAESAKWTEITRKKYTDDQLLERVNQTKRLID